MKNIETRTVTILLALIGAYLFYKEAVGVNILVFTVLSAVGVVIINKHQSIKKLAMNIAPALLCAIFLLVYPQTLTHTIWLLSYLVMWSSMEIVSRPITILIQGLVSIVLSPIRLFQKGKPKETETEQPKVKKTAIYIISSLIAISFLSLYVKSNPIFSDFFLKIDLSFT